MTSRQPVYAHTKNPVVGFRYIKAISCRVFRTFFIIWPEKRRQRRALLGLSDAHLRDIGVNPAEAHREARKSFWL